MEHICFHFGDNRRAAVWKPGSMTLNELCCHLREPVRTSETSRHYKAMTKAQRDAIKDRGGFFAGTLKGTRRKKAEVVSRSMITFDCDHINFERLETFLSQRPVCAVTYTTHSHTPEAPRARVLLPLTRDVTPDEYNAVARYLAAEIGMDMIDPCSFEINQMMYWPTASSDGEYIFNMYEGETLDPDAFLDEYPNWRDWTSLPMSAREKKAHELPKKNQEDPLTKVGVVGDFCRAYTIQDTIAKYLSDVYEPSAERNRYDYIPGEGRCGVVIYDDKFAYSHHGTDPAGGRLLNAFDLVRIHRFGDEPSSYRDMCELALQDEEVVRLNREERQSQASDDFAPDTRPDYSDWGQPISLDDEALPLFPMDALPEVLRDYAAAVAESTQTANEMSAVAILSTVSAAMRNLYKVEGKPDWREPTNIYGLIIAEPSERKSAVISLITKPIDEFVHAYNEEHKVEIEMSRATKQKLESRKNSLISGSRKKGAADEDFNDSLQEVVEQLVHFREKKPLKVYVDDTTPEKLVETLSENNSAISIISSEGGIFDVLSGTYSSKVNIDVFLKAYSGEHISVDRIMRNSISIEEACLTILLSVQPVVIGELMKNEKFRNRGLTARFLYTHPRSLVGGRNFDSESIPPETYERFKTLIFNILSEERGAKAEIIRLDEEARDVLREFYGWVEKRLTDEFSVYSDWIGKLAGNTLRIAGILARSLCLKKDVGDAVLENDAAVIVDGEVMRNAVRIGKYFFSHAVRAYSTMGVYSEFRMLQKVIAKVKAGNLRTVDRRDIMRSCSWCKSADAAQRTVEMLEDYGYIRLIALDTSDKLRGGRPKNPRYAVNPYIFE